MEQEHRVVFYIDFRSKNSLRALCVCSHASLYVPACTFMQPSNCLAVGEDIDEIPFIPDLMRYEVLKPLRNKIIDIFGLTVCCRIGRDEHFGNIWCLHL